MCNQAASSSPLDLLEGKEERELLISALDRLPRRCREILELALRKGWSQTRIADEIGITTKAVAKQYARARRLLKPLLSDPVGLEPLLASATRNAPVNYDPPVGRGGALLPIVSIVGAVRRGAARFNTLTWPLRAARA
jgi:hypothetical protein